MQVYSWDVLKVSRKEGNQEGPALLTANPFPIPFPYPLGKNATHVLFVIFLSLAKLTRCERALNCCLGFENQEQMILAGNPFSFNKSSCPVDRP